MHNTWENGCYYNVRFSVAVPSASPCSQNRHLYALKGTLQHWRLMPSMQCQGGRREERKRRKTQNPKAATHYHWPLSLSPSVFPCLSSPLQCQSASGPFASIFLSLPVGSHQSVDLPWMLALSANYTVYLTTVTAMAKKISAPLFANPQLGKQHFSEYCPPIDELKMTCSNIQQLMGILRPQQSICYICWYNSTKCIQCLLSSICTVVQ